MSPTQPVPKASLAYAESLLGYASSRLEPFTLRCWIVQRLMLDHGLGHESAEQAFEYALSRARQRSGGRQRAMTGSRAARSS